MRPLLTQPTSAREAMRANHQRAVFDAVHRYGPISRVDLAGLLRLSAASISDITGALIRRGLMFEARAAASEGVGRRKILLEVDYDHARVLGVKVANAAVHAALTDLKGEVVASAVVPLADTSVATIVEALSEQVQAMRASSPEPLAGLGVSLPGAVDHDHGIVASSPLLGWHDVHLGEELERNLGIPVTVENDVNALAAAEAWFGRGHAVRDFLVVTLGRGVGLGIVLDGALYRGPLGGAGELGHVVLDPEGPEARHSRRGSVEAYLSDSALLERAVERVAALPAGGSFDDLGRLADAGDAAAVALYAEAGGVLGRALAILANLFAPALIVLAGEGMRAAPHLLPAARRALDAFAFADLGSRIDLVVEPWGDDAWARGAATLAASRYLLHEAARVGGADRGGERSRPA